MKAVLVLIEYQQYLLWFKIDSIKLKTHKNLNIITILSIFAGYKAIDQWIPNQI